MFRFFCKDEMCRILTYGVEERCVLLAAEDLAADMEKCASEQLNKQSDEYCIHIGTLDNAAFCKAVSDWLTEVEVPHKNEGYTVKVSDKQIVIAGRDSVGTMWGIYTVSKEFLHIDPCYLFNDNLPHRCETVEIKPTVISDYPRSFKYRGLFINDEDLLEGFKLSGGIREHNYPFYKKVMHREVFSMVIETMLRLKMNTVIPATLLDLEYEYEKLLADMADERGLWISQHHIGVSHISYRNYMTRLGKSESKFSFENNRGDMIDVWRHYTKLWSKYKRVIWQLSLRGEGDEPVWGAGNDSFDRDKYGRLISEAYEIQYNLIKEITENPAPVCTVTLWMEGAQLYNEGRLNIPGNTIAVFSDIGYNQMFSEDFFNVNAENERSYGVYTHCAFWNFGPHLAPGTSPEKMYYNYSLCAEKGFKEYSVLNAANIREFISEVAANAAMTWDFDGYNCREFYVNYYKNLYGDENAEEIWHENDKYYRSLAALSDDALEFFCRNGNFCYHRFENLRFHNFIANEGCITAYGLHLLRRISGEEPKDYDIWIDNSELEKAIVRLDEVYNALCEISVRKNKKHYQNVMKMYPQFMRNMYSWYLCVYNAKKAVAEGEISRARGLLTSAVYYAENVMALIKNASYDKWANWYRGDSKIGINNIIVKTRTVLEQIKKC